MESTDKDLKKTYDIEQMAVIGKMHSMQWLKSNTQLSGHPKIHSDGQKITFKNQINEGTKESDKGVSISNVSDRLKLENNDPIINNNITNISSITNTNTFHSTLIVFDSLQKDMETVWNKDINVTSPLFPNSQSLSMQRLDEQNTVNMNLAENIVTVQLEQFRFNKQEKNELSDSHNEGDNDWAAIHDVPDSPKLDSDINSQVNSKQCHDNNNNNAKSKSQSSGEVKKGIHKTTTKIDTRRLSDQGIRKQAGNSLKESCISKQGSKDRNDLLDSSMNDDKTSTFTTDSKKVSVGITSKFNDRGGKMNGCNRLIIGKGTQMKEPQFYKHFSTFNDSSNKNKISMEGLNKKDKSLPSKLKSSRNESDKKSNGIDDTKKCHKVQVTRVQSYNVPYGRNKSLVKSQRYSRNATKLEEETSIKHTSGLNNSIGVSNSNENVSKKKCENQQTTINKQINDMQFNQSSSGKSFKDFSISECSMKSSGSVPCKKNYQHLPTTKTTINGDIRDDQGYMQKFKKDSNTYRRSTSTLQTFSKDLNRKVTTDNHKKNVADNNPGKDFKGSHICLVDAKVDSQPENSKITVYLHKTVNGASNINKTDTSNLLTVNNVQSVKSLNSCSNNTKDSTDIDTSVNMSQESQILQASCNETEVQFMKTEQENTSINNSNNKTNTVNPETKSIKFPDNVQEINVAGHSVASYTDNFIQQNKISSNPSYSNLHGTSNINNAQQMETHQNVQNKNYFSHNHAQYSNMSVNIQNSERDFYLLDVTQQKPEQTSHISPQNVSSHNNCNSTIPIQNGLPYQNIPTMYLNQFSNISTQHNQWNLPHPDMFLFGNMVNPAHSLNMPIQNSRHLCNTDFNNIQQTGYLQHPLFYVPQLCMQNWNPLLQYPAPLFQNLPYTNCNTYPNQVLPPNNLTDTMNCSIPTSMQNNPYKQFQQMQHLENNPNFFVPVKLENYMGNVQGSKSNVKMKDNAMNMKGNQYRASVSNEYQNCSQDAQLMVPFSYAVTMDSIARNSPSNIHMQMNQKYEPRALTTANYQRMPEVCSAYQNNQDVNNRKDDGSKIDSECMPPMVSPRECMYYGLNYSRKPDVQNSSLRSNAKPVGYMHPVNSQHYVPQYQKNATYLTSQKELQSRITMGRGTRKTMEQ